MIATVAACVAAVVAVLSVLWSRRAVRIERGRADVFKVKFTGALTEQAEVERTLAGALGFARYMDPRPDGTVDPNQPDDPRAFVLGEHTAASLAWLAAQRIRDLEGATTPVPPVSEQ